MAGCHIKLRRQLFDIFQHCELRCKASCCGWDAFDLSDHWLMRWCEFRDEASTSHALEEVTELEARLQHCEPQATVSLDRFFEPTAEALASALDKIRHVLAAYPGAR